MQGFTVRAVMTPLAPEGIRKSRNVAYAVTADGVTILHLGNIEGPPTVQQLDLITAADVVLAPAGGSDRGFMSYRAIHQLAQQVNARWLIPTHYHCPGDPARDLPQDPQEFLREMGSVPGSVEPVNRLQVTRNNLPPSLQIALLSPHTTNRRHQGRTATNGREPSSRPTL